MITVIRYILDALAIAIIIGMLIRGGDDHNPKNP